MAEVIRRGFDALSEGVAHVAPPVEAEASADPSVVERALDLLGDEVRTLAEPLFDESLESPDAWSREIERYLDRVRMAESVDPPGRLDAARRVADRLLALVESVGEDDPSDHRRLAQNISGFRSETAALGFRALRPRSSSRAMSFRLA